MKNEQSAKRILKGIMKIIISIFICILIVYALSLSFTYNIWKNARYLLNSENRKIYAAVCKNIDFMQYKLNTLEISSGENDSYIQVNLKKKFLPVIYYPFIILSKPEPYSDIDKMFKMYEELSGNEKPASVSVYDTFPDGRIMHEYRLHDGSLFIDGDVVNSKICYAVKTAMSYSYITGLSMRGTSFYSLPEELPENYSIKYLDCHIPVNHSNINISSFKGLQSLELRVYGHKEYGECFDLDFINDFPELKTLTLHWNYDNFDISDETKYFGIQKLILYTDTHTTGDAKILHEVFPNAEIEVRTNI